MVLEEGWAKDSAGAGSLVMRCLLPTSLVVVEQAEDHASRRHPMSQCSEGSKSRHWVQLEEVAVEPLQPSLSSLHRQQQQLCFVRDSF
jgi:hypothetical protein